MKNIFVILKIGVYIQGVYVSSGLDKEEAIKDCNKLAALDADDYHAWVVYSTICGQNVTEGEMVYNTTKHAAEAKLNDLG